MQHTAAFIRVYTVYQGKNIFLQNNTMFSIIHYDP